MNVLDLMIPEILDMPKSSNEKDKNTKKNNEELYKEYFDDYYNKKSTFSNLFDSFKLFQSKKLSEQEDDIISLMSQTKLDSIEHPSMLNYGPPKYGLTASTWKLFVLSRLMVDDIVHRLLLIDIPKVNPLMTNNNRGSLL